MGIHLLGQNPSSIRGKRLVLSWDSWEVVRLFVEVTSTSEIVSRLDEGLDEESARSLGSTILDEIERGHAERFEETLRSFVSTLDLVECSICDGTGIRTDIVGRSLGLDEVELDEVTSILLGRDRGSCDECGGEGTIVPSSMSLSFDLGLVTRFGRFLVECGGFEAR